ncbi:MAG: sugar phosphate isomerase/epimerase family protein [Planctomycetota bacterium]
MSRAEHRSDGGGGVGKPASRRGFLAAAAVGAFGSALGVEGAPAPPPRRKHPALKLGLVTYNLARTWDLATIVKNCAEAKFEGVELRTGHAHGVEVSLGEEERKRVRALFCDSPVELASLGSAFEFHSADPAELRKNIDGAKEYARLARDVGAKGIKVRPNGLQTARGIPEEATLRQIGESLAEVAEEAGKLGVEVRLEVHGSGTSRLANVRKILDCARHENVGVCWNSNASDLDDGGLEANFALVADRIRFVHLRDLYLEDYPWRRLFQLLEESGYRGYCSAEIPESGDPLRVMRYYRALFLAYQDAL